MEDMGMVDMVEVGMMYEVLGTKAEAKENIDLSRVFFPFSHFY